MARNNVTVEKLQGRLGRRAENLDGVCGLITNGVAVVNGLTLGTIYVLRSINDLEALKVDRAYDISNKVLLYHRVERFFLLSPGTELHLMVVAQTITLTQMADKANAGYAKKIIKDSGGRVKMVAIARNPATGYTPTITTGIDADVLAAIPKAQALVEEEFGQFRFAQIFLEGRGYSGAASGAVNLRAIENVSAPNVSVVIHQDLDLAAKDALFAGAAQVEDFLAIQSIAAVSQNAGERIDTFNLTRAAEGLNVRVGLSSNLAVATYSDTDLTTLHDKGFIFGEPVSGIDGHYFNDTHTCVALTSDYSFVENNRTINKAIMLGRLSLVPSINARLRVDSQTGQLLDIERSRLEDAVSGSLDVMLRDGDISGGVEVFINPAQNLLAGDDIEIELGFVPVSIGRKIKLKVGFTNPFNN